MAARKPTTRADTQKKPAAAKSTTRVDKRPPRGYHTFKNGMLNVAPKGDEQELVRSNQDTPLLRLPAEIRNRIWQFALGGKVYRQQHVTGNRRGKLMPQPCERGNAFSLLRTCRQIYAETGVLPFTINTFSITSYWSLVHMFKPFRKYQCSQIEQIHIEMSNSGLEEWWKAWMKRQFDDVDLSGRLPGLRRIYFRIFPCPHHPNASFGPSKAFLQSDIVPGMLAKGYQISIEEMGITANKFDHQWRNNTVTI